ncbi:Serine/threonine-protein kinase mug51 [Schizosaccharomyces pombe]|uniref:Serine/threonine-protein kinase mug51 n=1 Tax=Schizosaccharomyces pombe (strain 972 / ATCC 24843) TaxID=284812 RepID=MUG51_SCHPO|nr:variant protein kinase 19 family protein [Schizosaccharomyces pombe]Q9P7Q6.1 RecName: Full=Serine/threonine-protein kinase mug51; AltName: Full=Meiotically up-regulated gene 51 protein [Schizosaccharomyces pombe 972h-]CAB75777.1 variant protein kinase 19 family protein [Schizosaccharomyces pombe]|eukprot:NP_594688.1 variant protein kinase 19 family protein [Schizosaccharomyces pombe]
MPALLKINKKKNGQTKIDRLFSKRRKTSLAIEKNHSKASMCTGQSPLNIISYNVPPLIVLRNKTIRNSIEVLVEEMFRDIQMRQQTNVLVAQCPRMIVETQLIGLFQSNYTSVAEELEQSIRTGDIRRLYLNRSDKFCGESCLILRPEFDKLFTYYLCKFKDQEHIYTLIFKLHKLLIENPLPSYTSEELKFNWEERRLLISMGFLILAGTDSYGISLPNLGIFTHILRNSRNDLSNYLKKRPYREVIESSLYNRNVSVACKKKNEAFFGWKFRLCDAIGAGLVDSFMTTCGRAFRLTKKGLEMKF